MTYDEVVDLILKILRDIAGRHLGGPAVTARSYLLDIPGFDSISLAELVGQLEIQVGPLPEEMLMPEVFRTPTDIAAALLASTSAGRRR